MKIAVCFAALAYLFIFGSVLVWIGRASRIPRPLPRFPNADGRSLPSDSLDSGALHGDPFASARLT
jgi:hypothetical protein